MLFIETYGQVRDGTFIMETVNLQSVEFLHPPFEHAVLFLPGLFRVFPVYHHDGGNDFPQMILAWVVASEYLLRPTGTGSAHDAPRQLMAHPQSLHIGVRSPLRAAQDKVLVRIQRSVVKIVFRSIYGDICPALFLDVPVAVGKPGKRLLQGVAVLSGKTCGKYIQIGKRHVDETRAQGVCVLGKGSGEIICSRSALDEKVLSRFQRDSLEKHEPCIPVDLVFVHRHFPSHAWLRTSSSANRPSCIISYSLPDESVPRTVSRDEPAGTSPLTRETLQFVCCPRVSASMMPGWRSTHSTGQQPNPKVEVRYLSINGMP